MNEAKKTEFCLQTIKWVRELFLDPKIQEEFEAWQKQKEEERNSDAIAML